MVKYLILDFNGTIIDDVDLCFNLLNEMLEMKNLKPVSLDRYREIFTFPIIDYYKAAGFDFKNYSFDELARYFIKKYQPESLNCSLYPGCVDFLIKMKEQGYKLILLSASKLENLDEQVTHFNIKQYFDKILGLSHVHATSKIQIIKDYLKEQNIDPKDVIFIGDSTHDFEVSEEVKARCVLISHGHQARHILETTKCDIVESYKELENYLGGLNG